MTLPNILTVILNYFHSEDLTIRGQLRLQKSICTPGGFFKIIKMKKPGAVVQLDFPSPVQVGVSPPPEFRA